jgi:hypothetical protein
LETSDTQAAQEILEKIDDNWKVTISSESGPSVVLKTKSQDMLPKIEDKKLDKGKSSSAHFGIRPATPTHAVSEQAVSGVLLNPKITFKSSHPLLCHLSSSIPNLDKGNLISANALAEGAIAASSDASMSNQHQFKWPLLNAPEIFK